MTVSGEQAPWISLFDKGLHKITKQRMNINIQVKITPTASMVCFMLEVLDQYMAITTTTKAACNEFAIP
jgi:hypothetical protein